MAKTKLDESMLSRLRAGGIRRRTAELIAQSTDGRRKPAKEVRRAVSDLQRLIGEAEDRIHNGPAKRSAAAKKAARTRKAKAAKRSAAAKKGARTRKARA